jgi:hypothetical protein
MRARRSSRFLFPLILILVWLPEFSYAQQLWSGVLSPARAADWTQIGAGAIPTNRTQCGSTIAPYTGSPSTIANAINSCAAGTYVQLGSGTFNLNGTIFITANNVTLRGNGPKNTILNFSAGSACGFSHPAGICVAGGDDSFAGNAPANSSNVSGLTQGASSIKLGTQTAGTHKPQVGDVIEINMDVDGVTTAADAWPLIFSCVQSSGNCSIGSNGAADLSPAGPAQWMQITSITAGTCTDGSPCTVGVSPPIHMPNYGQKTVRAWWSSSPSVQGVLVQGMQLTGNDPILGFRWAAKSWGQNLELKNSGGGAPHYLYMTHSVQITFRDSYIVGGGTWQDEYAANCYGSGASQFENNILEFIRSGFVQEMCEGSVLTYNYHLTNSTNGSANPGNEEGLFNNHGCCSGYTLFEGNDATSFISDDYFGGNQFATLFRNRLYGKTSLDTPGNTGSLTPVIFGTYNRFANIIGNVLGLVGYTTNYQEVGGDGNSCSYGNLAIYAFGKGNANCSGGGPPDDLHNAPSSFRWGNWDVVTNAVQWNNSEVPTGLTNYYNTVASLHILPASFYYSAKPSWWGVTGQAAIPWPAIGPDVTGGNLTNSGGFANKIPARVCFEAVMGGSFSDTAPRSFDANACYSQTSSSVTPAPPSGLTAVVQ